MSVAEGSLPGLVGRAAQTAASVAEARRTMEVCNACRYCEGYCAVFPAMERRRLFADADLEHLANLCHNCQGCWHACQYAPPHEFGLNLPKAFAELRVASYATHAWPDGLARLFERNGLWMALATALGIGLVLLLTMLFADPGALTASHHGEGAFYAVIPYQAMVAVGSLTFGFSVLALVVASTRYWRAAGGGDVRWADVHDALRAAATTRHLGGGGEGCNHVDDRFSMGRRHAHLTTMWGFLLCFAATSVATVMDHGLGLIAPYPWYWPPVLLGTVGGIGLLVGPAALFRIKLLADPAPRAAPHLGMDYALLALLFLTSLTGLLLLVARATPAMGILLAVHLGFVLALFVTLPYAKSGHAPCRRLALVREAGDRRGEAAGDREIVMYHRS